MTSINRIKSLRYHYTCFLFWYTRLFRLRYVSGCLWGCRVHSGADGGKCKVFMGIEEHTCVGLWLELGTIFNTIITLFYFDVPSVLKPRFNLRLSEIQSQ